MGVIREELFVELATNKSHHQHQNFVSSLMTGLFYRPPRWNGSRYVDDDMSHYDFTVNREAALRAYAEAKAKVMDTGFLYSKCLRPYEFDDLQSLDRSQPWWGFEFETGYSTKEERARAVEYAWDVAEIGVSFDAEGEGAYGTEITFAPIEQSRVLDGSAPACKFIKFLSDNGLGENTGDAYIGTHFNFSLPDYTQHTKAAKVINNTLHMLPRDGHTRMDLFGRESIYGGAWNQGNWVEIKLFRTTYDEATFQKYVRVCDALTRIALATQEVDDAYYYCSNLVEMVRNKDLEPVLVQDDGLLGSPDESYISDPGYLENYDYDEEF